MADCGVSDLDGLLENPMITLKIDRGIPIYSRQSEHTLEAQLRKAMGKMAVGDSLFWGHNNTAPYRAAKYAGIKIATRKDKNGGWRIWRTE